MVLKYVISPDSALAEDFLIKVWEAQSDTPGSEVYTQTVGQPHNAPVTITVNGLDRVVHIVRLFAATSLTLLHEYTAEPTSDTVTIYDPIYFKVGTTGGATPTAGTSTYTDAALIGFTDNQYTVFRNTYGYLLPGIAYTNNPIAGGFTLAVPDQFNDTEEFFIQRQNSPGVVVTNDSVVGKWFKGFIDIAANISYAPTHLRCLLRFTAAATYSFDTSVPIGYGFMFTNFGSAATCHINFNMPLIYGGATTSSYALAPMESALFTFDGTNFNLVTVGKIPASAGVLPGTIMGYGTSNVGNVPAGNPAYRIAHGLNISGEYAVFVNIQSNNNGANAAQDNGITSCWYYDPTDKPNAFYVSMQELLPETQDISFNYLIVKL